MDKSWTTGLLEQAGLRVPDTICADRLEGAIAAFHELGGDVIVKPLFGSMGLGMLRLTDEDLAWRVFRTIERIQGVYYLQRTIPHDGSDIRAFVIGDRVAGAIERSAPGWRTNVSRGGSARPVTLTPALEAMAVTFVAPHSLHARPLVVPAGRDLAIVNRTADVPVAVIVDGHIFTDVGSGGRVDVRFDARRGLLASLPEATFFRRYRNTFASAP